MIASYYRPTCPLCSTSRTSGNGNGSGGGGGLDERMVEGLR